MIQTLNTIKNNQLIYKSVIYIKLTKKNLALLNILWNENLIAGYQRNNRKGKNIKIFLKYKKTIPVISNIKILSKPGNLLFLKVSQIWKINSNLGVFLINTTKGLLTINLCKKYNLGGEPLFLIY
jgi:small subunit ribosomal protein S8